MRVIILAVLTIFSLNCSAENYIRLTGVSMHNTAGNNALNYGIGLEHELNNRWSVAGGWYRNSEWHGSAYSYGRYAVYRDDIWNIGNWCWRSHRLSNIQSYAYGNSRYLLWCTVYAICTQARSKR